MKSRKQFWVGILVGAIAMIIVGALIFGIVFSNKSSSYFSSSSNVTSNEDLDIDSIGKNISLLEALVDAGFILDYDKAEMEQGIYRGFIEALNDPYSVYYSPEAAKTFLEQTTGSYCGMGATISENSDTGEISIVKVFAGSPAEKAGVKSGDVVVGVDNESVSGLSSDEVVALVRGEEGTTFTLNTTREGERIDFEITRAEVQVQQVTCDIMDDIGYISINQFIGTADEETAAALIDLTSQGATKLIIDLRNNIGGSLDVLLNISEYFLDKDEVIIKEVDKKGTETVSTAGGNKLFEGDIIILTNGYTASAAEVFTAALHDNYKAFVIGTQTYGKGIVQQSLTLNSGAILKLTTEYYYTPNDVCIHKVGITPDYVLEYDASSGVDNQLEAAISALR